MRAVVLRSLAVVGIGAIVLAGVLYLASTVDGRPPTVVGVTLTQTLADEPSIGLTTTSLEVTFTEPVGTTSAEQALAIEPAVEGSVSWSGTVMIFTPRQPLSVATTYTVSIEPGVEDLAGNRMTDPPEPFVFETTGPPEVVETVPADGASDVALEEPIDLQFSTLMDTASVEAALRLRPAFPHEVRWSGQLLEIVPTVPLRPETDYRVEIGEDAFDVSGVALGSPVSLTFRTLAPGLELSLVVPSDGTDGIAQTSPIAVFFDRPIDPDSLSNEVLTITPTVAGSIALVDELGNQPADPEDGRVLRFTPSGPLPANTTFEVVLASVVTGVGGGGLAEPVSWSFTTGAPHTTLSNQITFLTDRAGVANLWAMNVDGTAAHQLSTELTAILDYAVSPDGNSFVVGDGRRLVMVDANGSNRRVLTEEGFLEFDPTYAPNGQRLAFARADADTGLGLGIWERSIPGDASPIEVQPDATPTETPVASGDVEEATNWLRAPRYAPDGEAIAFADPAGWVGIVELATDVVIRVGYEAQAPPQWLPDGSAILLTGERVESESEVARHNAPVGPLERDQDVTALLLERSGGAVRETGFGTDAEVVAVAGDGRIAYLRRDGSLRITDDAGEPGSVPPSLRGEGIGGAAFAPGEDALVVVVLGTDAERGAIERIELGSNTRDALANDGWHPRWLP
ncbi:MAG TPA: Ig-like domain-containing protein [Candidatus Limnocylindrales bacterium]|nr:Ig-like domain-containing protein [Candidatus Limnocylindrales bacterium]